MRATKTRPVRSVGPATARLRAELLLAPDAETLVGLFADALAEHGVDGHFCATIRNGAPAPLLGDRPDLLGRSDALAMSCGGGLVEPTRMLLASPAGPLGPEAMSRLRGYAELYAARALALRELADDVATECGLTLRQRFVLGRRLAGLAPVDVAAEAGISVATVRHAEQGAVERLGVADLPAAIALAARRGWLAVTSLRNCSFHSQKATYNLHQNG